MHCMKSIFTARMFLRYLILILALVLSLGTLMACNNKTPPTPENPPEDKTPNTQVPEDTEPSDSDTPTTPEDTDTPDEPVKPDTPTTPDNKHGLLCDAERFYFGRREFWPESL